ncbi:uncharacterized protein LOC123894340 isoform X2 [Trifolium pratense]|uniref:uncharacterized protein LOC123894340 isoform X2 n=1 Tax=Trifolium pratense TaxID=57577 RepID=UPI001E6973C0|nr:uncharacterized protein LOC123894340 isoform X2 [Trifolium pratense]
MTIVPVSLEEFYTYPSLIRYVDYAKKNKIGIYGPVFKSIRKWEIDALKKQNPIGHRKTTTALSIPGRPSLPNSDSLAADQEHYFLKSIRKQEIDALKKHNPIGHRKTTGALSIPGRPRLPNSDSLPADHNDDSKPSSSGKSTDEDVEDYVPEQYADVSTNMEIDEADEFRNSRSKEIINN